MSDSRLLAPAPTLGSDGSAAAQRTVRRRPALPTGRAVIGGFLVAVSGLGIYLAWADATAGPTDSFVVAARDLPIGTRLTAADLDVVTMDLPDALAERAAFRSAAELEGVKVINPIAEGELVQASSLISADAAASELEVAFAIERSRAVGGTLEEGEYVDVLATFGSGEDTYTTTVLQGARVLGVDSPGGSLGAGDVRVIRLAVANADDARALAHAVNVAKVVLVRGDPSSTDRGGTYRAPAASGDATTNG